MCKLHNIKKVLFILGVIVLTFLFTIKVNAITKVENVKFTGCVNTNTLNVRQGPGTNYKIVTTLKKGSIVNVIGKIDDWYIIQTENNIFGLCSKEYIEDMGEYTSEMAILNAINEQREKKKIKKLTLDAKLSEIAKIKAQDIIDNNYFSHESKKLGTPFEMLEKYDIKFMTVGENIAKSNDIEDFVKLVTENDSYRQNAISNDYNYTGISILPIDEFNYIYVQLFVGRQ